MSDQSQGPGWWQASDGKWYPPEQSPAPQAGGGSPQATVEVGAALTYGWNKFVQYIGPIIIVVLVIFAVNIIFGFIAQSLAGGGGDIVISPDGNVEVTGPGWGTSVLQVLLSLVGLFITFLIGAGLIRIALAVTRGETPDASQLFKTENLGSYIVATLIVVLAMFVASGLFAVLGGVLSFPLLSILGALAALAISVLCFFFGFFILDRGLEPVAGIRSSVDLVRAHGGPVLLFVIVASIIMFFTCGLGIGVAYIAGAHVYRTLNGEAVAP